MRREGLVSCSRGCCQGRRAGSKEREILATWKSVHVALPNDAARDASTLDTTTTTWQVETVLPLVASSSYALAPACSCSDAGAVAVAGSTAA